MPEIGTSGSMSGDGKRSVAEWPKLPRPSSTLPFRILWACPLLRCYSGASGHRLPIYIERVASHLRQSEHHDLFGRSCPEVY
jgi:hypothetical protein